MSRTGFGGWLSRLGWVVVAMVAVVAAIQWHANAYQADLLGDLDEPAHYVTTRMVYEYLRAPQAVHPVRHAEQYYLHFPLVGLGHWPPGLYGVGAAWAMVAGPGTGSLLVLMALFGVFAGLAVYTVNEKLAGRVGALAAGLLFLLTPAFQRSVSSVMGDLLTLGVSLVAVLCWERAVKEQKVGDAWAFAALALAAVMVKPIALAVFAVAAVGFWRLKPRAWIPIALAVAICGGYQLLTLKMAVGMVDEPTPATLASGLVSFGQSFARQLGWPALALAAGGAVVAAKTMRRSFLLASLVVFAVATAGLVLATNVGAALFDRYYFVPYVMTVALAGIAVDWIWGRGNRLWAAGALAAAVCLHPGVLHPYAKPVEGFQVAAEAALRGMPKGSVVLVGSNGSTTEQVLIGELARETAQTRELYTLRSTQLLTKSDWFGRGYEVMFGDALAVDGELRRVPVNAVVLYTGGGERYPHFELLVEALEATGSQWERSEPAAKFVLYRRRKPLLVKIPRLEERVNGLGGRVLVPQPE